VVAGALIGVNWFLFVFAVDTGFVVQISLGYFITPLVNVLLGVIVLQERLHRLQWVAVGLAAAGVAYLTLSYGALPWIALGLAFSFGTYGLVKKQTPGHTSCGCTCPARGPSSGWVRYRTVCWRAEGS
jgi:chloramphenicol-sensitive protein RarD